jgi:hypothetical protein
MNFKIYLHQINCERCCIYWKFYQGFDLLQVLDLCFCVCSVELYSLCIYEALEEIVMSYNESIKKLTIFSFFFLSGKEYHLVPARLTPSFLKLFLRML